MLRSYLAHCNFCSILEWPWVSIKYHHFFIEYVILNVILYATCDTLWTHYIMHVFMKDTNLIYRWIISLNSNSLSDHLHWKANTMLGGSVLYECICLHIKMINYFISSHVWLHNLKHSLCQVSHFQCPSVWQCLTTEDLSPSRRYIQGIIYTYNDQRYGWGWESTSKYSYSFGYRCQLSSFLQSAYDVIVEFLQASDPSAKEMTRKNSSSQCNVRSSILLCPAYSIQLGDIGKGMILSDQIWGDILEAEYCGSPFHTCKIIHFWDLQYPFPFAVSIESTRFSCDRWTNGCDSSHVVHSTLSTGWSKQDELALLCSESVGGHFISILVSKSLFYSELIL